MFQRLWVQIPAPYGHFFTYLFVVKLVMCVWKDENKLKRRQSWPILKNSFDVGGGGWRVTFQPVASWGSRKAKWKKIDIEQEIQNRLHHRMISSLLHLPQLNSDPLHLSQSVLLAEQNGAFWYIEDNNLNTLRAGPCCGSVGRGVALIPEVRGSNLVISKIF